jgi:hypothetical protein
MVIVNVRTIAYRFYIYQALLPFVFHKSARGMEINIKKVCVFHILYIFKLKPNRSNK